MISDERQEQAIGYLLGELSPAEQGVFASELQRDPELQAFVREMRESLGLLAQAVPAVTPPPGLRDRILAIPQAANAVVPVPEMEIPQRTRRDSPVAWMVLSVVMALVALAAVYDAWTTRAGELSQAGQMAALRQELEQLHGTLDSQRQQMAALASAHSLSNVRVVALNPQNPALGVASAVVVWNSGEQQGVIKGSHFSGAGAGKDYQLWLIDPSAPGPVSAGILTVSPDGNFETTFKPVHPVNPVAKFAISIEVGGGSTAPRGPIVFVGG